MRIFFATYNTNAVGLQLWDIVQYAEDTALKPALLVPLLPSATITDIAGVARMGALAFVGRLAAGTGAGGHGVSTLQSPISSS